MDNQRPKRFSDPWKAPAGGDLPSGKPFECSPLEASSDDDRYGRALFNFKSITYLVTFLKGDPRKADFVPLDDLPWYEGIDKPDRDALE